VSRPAKIGAKISAVIAIAAGAYAAYANPYGGVLAFWVFGFYYAAVFALIFITDRVVRAVRSRREPSSRGTDYRP
jgi:hypothetical protein